MTLVNVGGLMRWPGITTGLSGTIALATDATLDAAGEYKTYLFQAREAMTLSHVSIRTGVVSGSPTATIRIETIGTDGLPTGTLWATNTSGTTATLVTNTSTLTALTASATMVKGDIFGVKILYASGTSIIVSRIVGPRQSALQIPYGVINTSGSPVKAEQTGIALLGLGSSATTFYCLDNTLPMSVFTNNNFNNTSSAKRALRFQLPFNARCVGFQFYTNALADFNGALLDDAGSELSSSNTAMDADWSGGGNLPQPVLFDNAVTLTKNTWYRASVEPTSATNVTFFTFTLPSANYRSAWPGGTNNLYATYTSGGGWVDTATDQIPILDILIDQIDDGTGSGGVSRARVQGGF